MRPEARKRDRKQHRHSHRLAELDVQPSWNQASCTQEATVFGEDFDGPRLAEEMLDCIIASHLLDAEFRPLFEGDVYFNVKKEL